MQFRVLGHACLEVASCGRQLICDPWLVGSAYWRSWWNYPPVPSGLVETLDPDFIYLTHMHWDHFHGPTLRRLGLHRHILIPKTPDRRIYNDLRDMGCDRITELPHGKPFDLAPGFVVTSYQFGHFPDSILMIEADGKTIMNANDCKMMGLPLSQILRNHPDVEFVFRSHSSANARLCFEITDKGGAHIDDQAKYSVEFAEFVAAVGARYAIPFASNNCYLHPETAQFNKHLNLGVNVQRYFDLKNIKSPECVVLAPGDGWDDERGFLRTEKDWYSDLEGHIQEYQEAKRSCIEATMLREDNAVLKPTLVAEYTKGLFAGTPFFIRRLFRDKPITFVAHSKKGDTAYEIDIYKRQWRQLREWNDQDCPIQIHAQARIFEMCVRQVNWNSLRISKSVRFRVRHQDRRIITYFTELNDLFDCEVLPLSKSLNARFIGVWLRRYRELFLYAQIVMNMVRGRDFQYSAYLPKPGVVQPSPQG
jgi:UDP-MurNAc hydroxylase